MNDKVTKYSTLDDIARTYAAVAPSTCKNPREWTIDEAEILRVFCPTHTYVAIAKALKRSKSALTVKAWKLGIRKHPHWTDNELAKLFSAKTSEEASLATGRSLASVESKRHAILSGRRRCATKE